MKNYIKYACLLLVIQFSNTVYAESYKNIVHHLDTRIITNIEIENIEVTYVGYTKSRADKVIKTIDNALDYTFLYLTEIHPEAERCKNIPLRIVQINDAILNDRSIMTFLMWDLWGDSDIFAVYDSQSSNDINSTIYLNNDITNRALDTVIFHEILHYSQDMMCLAIDESEAYRFTETIGYLN